VMNAREEAVVIVGAARTAIGTFGGALKDVDAHELAATCIRAALVRAGVDPAEVDEVVIGQVGQVGPDAYNARRVTIAAGLPPRVPAMNVNRLCSSGLQAIVTGAQQLLLGEASVVVAGGNESMSRQPFLDYQARAGWRLGPHELVDGTLSLVTDPFGRYPMGVTAERVAERFGVGREEQDAFAVRSQELAHAAIREGHFEEEIVPVEVPKSDEPFARDEHPREGVTIEKLAKLRAVFQESGTVTAGNSSGINDGAGAVVLMRESDAAKRGLRPRLRLVGSAVTGIEPEIMGYAPALAVPAVLEKVGLTLDDIDLIELNEAFAAQAVAVIRALDVPEEKVNPSGGAIALGHPVGATGAILAIKLLHGLERLGRRRGIVTMCIGGGQGMAAVFERPDGD
jgi:acetyl-CoA C-acetyltransferase